MAALSWRGTPMEPGRAPKLRGFPTYSASAKQPLLGVPIHEGILWHLSLQDRFEMVTVQLHVNGIAFSSFDGLEVSVSLSPFSLVRNCRFQTGECARLKSFKISSLENNPCCYFAARSLTAREAEEERSDWVLAVSHAILLITDSIMPRSRCMSCDPIPGLPHTRLRLLAGHLVHRDDTDTISLLFCELSAPRGGVARMVLYEDESCHVPVMNLLITSMSECQDIVGINCSCFEVGGHFFAAHTPSERKLWLRALMNLKVKIQNDAPEPTDEDLRHYRDSIREQIFQLEAGADPRISREALLARVPSKAFHIVGDGDVDQPIPADAEEHPHGPAVYESPSLSSLQWLSASDQCAEPGLVPPRSSTWHSLKMGGGGGSHNEGFALSGLDTDDPFVASRRNSKETCNGNDEIEQPRRLSDTHISL